MQASALAEFTGGLRSTPSVATFQHIAAAKEMYSLQMAPPDAPAITYPQMHNSKVSCVWFL
jgi:hypothetical protein